MDFSNITDEQKRAFSELNTAEEILELAKQEGIELTDEQIKEVSGGYKWENDLPPCPHCGSTDVFAMKPYGFCCNSCHEQY